MIWYLIVWLVGAIVVHYLAYKSFARPDHLKRDLRYYLDFSIYVRDSGVAMVILLWPIFVPLILGMFGFAWLLGQGPQLKKKKDRIGHG